MNAPRLAPAVLLAFSLALVTACEESGETVGPPGPSALVILQGDGEVAVAGTVVRRQPTVRVLDTAGDGVAEVSVSFVVTSGGGQVTASSARTDLEGTASTLWILGLDPSRPQALQASAAGLSAAFTATAQPPEAGLSYVGREGYVEYLAGDLPIVLSAPHGGDVEPTEIPDRTWGTMARDRNTSELALVIRSEIREQTGLYPHVILSHLHRVKLDPNREIGEAAQGNPHAERAWYEFHSFIEAAEASVSRTFGDGFYVDLHGHAHEIPRIELGYLLSAEDLDLSDDQLGLPGVSARSSLRALANTTTESFAELLRGETSLGGLLDTRGFPCVPGPRDPGPGSNPYFTGGYNTIRHGSRDGGSISGVQLEANFPGVRDTPENRAGFARALTEVLDIFFEVHFERDLEAGFGAVATSSRGGGRGF